MIVLSRVKWCSIYGQVIKIVLRFGQNNRIVLRFGQNNKIVLRFGPNNKIVLRFGQNNKRVLRFDNNLNNDNNKIVFGKIKKRSYVLIITIDVTIMIILVSGNTGGYS